MPSLDTPLRGLLGSRTANLLASELDLRTLRDLLRHYPRRHDERGQLTDLRGLKKGQSVTVLARVRKVNARRKQPRRPGQKNLEILTVTVTDGTADLDITWFQSNWREKELRVGAVAYFAGTVGEFQERRQLLHPEYELLGRDGSPDDGADFPAGLVPIYPGTAKLTSFVLRRSARLALAALSDDPLPEPLPAEIRAKHGLPDLNRALHDIHLPPDRAALFAARERLTWDEAFVLQTVLARRRWATRTVTGVPRPGRPDGLRAAFDAGLPFTLTAGQEEIGAVLDAELSGAAPMYRLLQGEVGSGKTVVALRAMLRVVDSGGQAVLLAPTEVLAVQHERTLRRMLGGLAEAGELTAAEHATRLVLLTGSLGAAARRAALAAAADGSAGLVVGTHALIQEGVGFADLGLVVVDEQHRFGVEQRDALRAKAAAPPHVLVMTATPIPRTVAMTVFGDLETSSLRELPAGRSPIRTAVAPTDRPGWLDRAWARVVEDVGRGYQAYVVCPRIGGDDADDDAAGPTEPLEDRRPPLAVLDVAANLASGPLKAVRVGILHGRLPPEEKDAVMRRFLTREIDVLVATTVIEVGVDVANATTMVVLDAERFGLSQLHQLRGRVGRGSAAGMCILVTDLGDGPSRDRLEQVAATTDGFEVARLDLLTRREGDVLGAAQSGAPGTFRLLSLRTHEKLIGKARAAAIALVDADPQLRRHPALAAEIAGLETDAKADYLDKA